jgi:hypothetical protein
VRRLPGNWTTTVCGCPSADIAVTWTARKAGAETVGGLTPLARIVNVAGTRALPAPPAGLDEAVPGEPPPLEPDDG